jgi:hypothetical protein
MALTEFARDQSVQLNKPIFSYSRVGDRPDSRSRFCQTESIGLAVISAT